MGMFGGKSGSQSKSSDSGSSKSSVQKQINAEQARIGKGNWNQKLNDLVKQRDNPSSGGGIAALKNAPKNIARDIGMGVGLTKRDADYYRRTADTIARTQGAAAADRYIKQMSAKGGDAAAGVKLANVADAVNYGQRTGMLNKDGSVNKNYMSSDDGGIASLKNTTDDMSDQYAENLRRYEEYMESQKPQGPAVTPEMRQAALQTFESQQGAGQIPYYMAAARRPPMMPMPFPRDDISYRQGESPDKYGMPVIIGDHQMPPRFMQQNPNMSPAFQYAAQNYDVLGGSQRLAPRPMEMMSVAERRQINDMAQAMADQQAEQRQAETDYQQGMDMVMGGGGKGGPRTGPQLPPGMVGLPRTPDYGGGMPRPPLPFAYGGGSPKDVPIQFSPFASMLSQRFGGFGGQ